MIRPREPGACTGSLGTGTLGSHGDAAALRQGAGGGGTGSTVLSRAAQNCTTRRQATWTATGWLTDAVKLHTATLLPNGKVLVAGEDGHGFLDQRGGV